MLQAIDNLYTLDMKRKDIKNMAVQIVKGILMRSEVPVQKSEEVYNWLASKVRFQLNNLICAPHVCVTCLAGHSAARRHRLLPPEAHPLQEH